MTNVTNNTTATNCNAANTNTTNHNDLPLKVNEAAVAGAQSILGFAGNLAADGHLKMAITIKLAIKASEDNMVVRTDDRTSSTHAVADVTLDVHADIDGSIAITGDGRCHGQRR